MTLDCADPQTLARFYGALVDGYRPPQWPGQDVPQQVHLDLRADDLDAAEELALELGAARPVRQPGDGRLRVLLDPAGHPFCLTSS